jgi:tRNA-guanine family transglycosylase
MNTLKFYMTSNIGGGGGTVSRLFKYLPNFNSLASKNIGILLNYNYLTFYEKDGLRKTERMIFDKSKLEYLNKNKISFNNFINIYVSDNFNKNVISDKFEFLLDSGSGKILADSVVYYDLDYNQSKKLIFDLVDHHIEFAMEKKSNYVIAMDYCYKNTYKNKEGKSYKYQDIIMRLSKDTTLQNELLLKSLNKISDLKSKTKLYAPIHGTNKESFIEHYESIRELEIKSGLSFSGFALGGLNIFRNKYGKEIVDILKHIRSQKEERPIHILGSAGINKIIPLIYAGANSFDCHTPWRRANENYEISMPILNNNLDFCVLNDKTFKNISIQKLSNNIFKCDCPVCKQYNLSRLDSFIANKKSNIEDFHLAKILIYFHGIYQYSYILQSMEKIENNYQLKNFIEQIPNKTLRDNYLDICI